MVKCFLQIASPDGLQGTDYVIEIKCPYVLYTAELHPKDFHKLKKSQRNNFFLHWAVTGTIQDENSNSLPKIKFKTEIRLKKNHAYYWQIQTQMKVLGRPNGYLVV